MSEPASPREVFHRLLDGIANKKWGELADLYDDDAVVQILFAPPAPIRLEGREQLRAHFSAGAAAPLEIEIQNLVIHETADPEVVIGEFDYRGVVTTSGRSFSVPNIQVLVVRNGKIVASRDYHNHLVLAEVVGALPDVIAALAPS